MVRAEGYVQGEGRRGEEGTGGGGRGRGGRWRGGGGERPGLTRWAGGWDRVQGNLEQREEERQGEGIPQLLRQENSLPV
eukprot:763008-Hanusia_phi.AAC.1